MNGAATLQPAQIDDLLNDVAHGASLGWSTWFALLRHCGVERRHEVRDACSWALSGELRRIAHGLLRQRQVSAARFEADATSIVATEFVTLMDEAAEGRLDEVDLPRALLARGSGRAFAVLLSSELGVDPAAGMDACVGERPCSPRHAPLLPGNWGASRRRTRCSRPRTRACVEG